MLTAKQLKLHADKFLKENYGLELEVPLKLNGRMKTTYGWFRHKRDLSGKNRGAVSVELNKFFVENNEESVVLDVLHHELVHYALFVTGKPHKDGHPVFESELRKLGIVSQDNIGRHQIKNKSRKLNLYVCQKCEYEHYTARALKHNGIFHSCTCGGKLASKGKIEKAQ